MFQLPGDHFRLLLMLPDICSRLISLHYGFLNILVVEKLSQAVFKPQQYYVQLLCRLQDRLLIGGQRVVLDRLSGYGIRGVSEGQDNSHRGDEEHEK